eukprot:5507230-Pleurochrysis_carterae.AAC.2
MSVIYDWEPMLSLWPVEEEGGHERRARETVLELQRGIRGKVGRYRWAERAEGGKSGRCCAARQKAEHTGAKNGHSGAIARRLREAGG